MNIVAFAASNSRNSINGKLIGYAAELIESEAVVADSKVEILDLNDYEMPIFSVDRENDSGVPDLAQMFFDKIGQADGLLISFAEHNGFYTAAYKNLFDWASRIDVRVYQDKPTVMFATSPGGGGAGSVLQAAVNSAQFFGNEVRASLSIPQFFDNFDQESGRITNSDVDAAFRDAVASLT